MMGERMERREKEVFRSPRGMRGRRTGDSISKPQNQPGSKSPYLTPEVRSLHTLHVTHVHCAGRTKLDSCSAAEIGDAELGMMN
jgi:hypothetical protein